MDEVIDRDRLPEIRHVRQMLVDVVVERELSLLNEHRHGQARELFGHRGDIKQRLRRDRDAMLKIRAAVTVLIDDRAVLDDHDGRAWRIGPIPLGKELVNLRGVPGTEIARGRQQMNPQRAHRQATGNIPSGESHHAAHCGTARGQSEV